MNIFVLLPFLFLLATAINIPLGYLRHEYRKFTFGWFFYTHLSIPVIIYLRTKFNFDVEILPLTVAGAMAGQLLGGIIARRKNAVQVG